MIKILSVIALTFVLLIPHIQISFAETGSCPLSTDPCGKGSHSTCDINNLCDDSPKKKEHDDKKPPTIHESKTITIFKTDHKTTKHDSNGGKGKVSMPVFLEVFDIPKNSPVVIVNNATQKSVDSFKAGHIRGEIQNIGQNPVTVKFITATFYDMFGVIAFSPSIPISPSNLQPGQSAPFDISFVDDKNTPFNPFKDTSKVKYQIDWSPRVEQ